MLRLVLHVRVYQIKSLITQEMFLQSINDINF